MERGIHTRNEIKSQTDAWSDALDVVDKNQNDLKRLMSETYEQVLFTGCGSTYYLSLAAAALFQELTGRQAKAIPGGELLLNPKTALNGGKTLLVAVSRSGSTTETVRAVEMFKQEKRGNVLAITNYGEPPLASLADAALVIARGQEQSVAQTRSFASMYVTATAMTLLVAGREEELKSMRKLPDVGNALMTRYEPLTKEIGENMNLDRFYFLGSGGRYGLACEVNLKMKEMTLTHSEPFHFLEFRHGPMSMICESAAVVGMLSEKNFSHEQTVLNEMQAKGGTIVALGEAGTQIAFESGIPESARGVLYLPMLQWMAYHRSMAKGLNPDQPEHLSAVIQLAL